MLKGIRTEWWGLLFVVVFAALLLGAFLLTVMASPSVLHFQTAVSSLEVSLLGFCSCPPLLNGRCASRQSLLLPGTVDSLPNALDVVALLTQLLPQEMRNDSVA